MINISELIGDPDFTQPNGVQIKRTTYTIQNHMPVITESTLKKVGIITIANDIELDMTDEADLTTEAINVFTYDPLYVTSRDLDGTNRFSDIVIFEGNEYKVMKVLDDTQYGFSRATCVKIKQDVM